MRARLVGKRLDGTAEERQAIVAYYDTRAGAPLFADASGLTPIARAVLAELALADDWGLPAGELVPAKLAVELCLKYLDESFIAQRDLPPRRATDPQPEPGATRHRLRHDACLSRCEPPATPAHPCGERADPRNRT